MGPANNALRVLEEIPPSNGEPALLGDLRFRALLCDDDWSSLPAAIRARFSRRIGRGDMTVYVGQVTEVRMNFAGRALVQLARLIGGPFPTTSDVDVASVVTVTEKPTGGQTWTRLYARRARRPQIIHSTKLFAGPTGLEERVGCGIGMALVVQAGGGSLVFRSLHYFLRLGRLRLVMPRWATPGALTVTHAEIGDGWFTFTLDVTHPRLGMLIHQSAKFRESKP